jgi:hypothetical protein
VSNGPTDDDLVGIFKGETIVTVVKDDFDEGVDGGGSGSFVEEGLAFFLLSFGWKFNVNVRQNENGWRG